MNDPLPTSNERKTIASVTLLLLENRDGVRYCDTISAIDEAKMTPYDVAKFQFHCFHWFAAMHEILVRKMVHENAMVEDALRKHEGELRQLNERLKALSRPNVPQDATTE